MMLKPGDLIQRPKSSNAYSSLNTLKRKTLNTSSNYNRHKTLNLLNNDLELDIK